MLWKIKKRVAEILQFEELWSSGKQNTILLPWMTEIFTTYKYFHKLFYVYDKH